MQLGRYHVLWQGAQPVDERAESQVTNGPRVGEPKVCHYRLGVCVGARQLLDGDSEGALDHVDLSVADQSRVPLLQHRSRFLFQAPAAILCQ